MPVVTSEISYISLSFTLDQLTRPSSQSGFNARHPRVAPSSSCTSTSTCTCTALVGMIRIWMIRVIVPDVELVLLTNLRTWLDERLGSAKGGGGAELLAV